MRGTVAHNLIFEDQIDGSSMEARVARIESDVAKIQVDVRELRTDVKAANEADFRPASRGLGHQWEDRHINPTAGRQD